jgi:hypothetical protein
MAGTLRVLSIWAVVSIALVSGAHAEDDPQLNVIVRFPGGLPAELIPDAEKTAAHIFDQARVAVQWHNCSSRGGQFLDPTCAGGAAATDLVIQIVVRSRKARDTVFGVAFVEGLGGAYADIFLDRLQRMQDREMNVSLPRLLGCVIAHEMGHLLLGEHSHSPDGLMLPRWESAQLNKLGKGNLRFDPKQAGYLRARVLELAARAIPTTLASGSGN